MVKTMFRGAIIIIIPLLLLIINAYAEAEIIYARQTPQTYFAQRGELLIIHLFKYDEPFFLKVDFKFLKKGIIYDNSSNADNVLTILSYGNHTIWDINDTQGTNISIYDNDIYELQFKSLYVLDDDFLAFNITEIDTTSRPYTTSVERTPMQNLIIILFFALILSIFLFIAYEIRQRMKEKK